MPSRWLLLIGSLLTLILPALEAGRYDRGGSRSGRGNQKDPGELYVNAPVAQLKQDKTVTAPVAAEVPRGTKVKVLERGDGRWLKVALAENSSVSGWIYFNKLIEEKPKEIQAQQLAFASGISTSDLESGGAIRGLKKASQVYAQKQQITSATIQDLHQLQTFPLTLREFDKNQNGNLDPLELKAANEAYRRWVEERLQEFLKSGQLGEYAE